MFKIVHTSPVLTPDSMRIESGYPENCYQSGPYLTHRAARRKMKQLINAQFERWVKEYEGETPFWHYAPSGNVYEAPDWFNEYGYKAVDRGSDYWHIEPK